MFLTSNKLFKDSSSEILEDLCCNSDTGAHYNKIFPLHQTTSQYTLLQIENQYLFLKQNNTKENKYFLLCLVNYVNTNTNYSTIHMQSNAINNKQENK